MADLKRKIVAEFSAENKAKAVMAGFRRGLDNTGQAMKRMAKVGAVMAVAAAAGLAYMVKKQMEAIDATAKLSRRLNMTTENLVAMQHGAGIAGVQQETFNKALEVFVRRLGEVDMGVGQATYALDKLGLDYKELIGLSADEAFGRVADQIKGLATQAEKAAAANYLFGRSGQSLLNFFEEGSKGLQKYKEFVEKTGLAFSDLDAAQVEAANDALTRTRAVLTGIFRQATIQLAPYIEVLANKFVDLATAGEGVGANVVDVFEAMSLGVMRFGREIEVMDAKWKAFHAGVLEGSAGILAISPWKGKFFFDPLGLFGMEGGKSVGEKIKELRTEAQQLWDEAAQIAESTYERQSAIEKFYDDLRRKAAKKTAKSVKESVKEQQADAIRARIAAIDREVAEIDRKLVEAKKAAEEEKNIIIKAAQERVNAVRRMDYATRMERIQNLEAYVEANEKALGLVLEANKILQDELKALELKKWDAMKRWGKDASDIYLNLDRIAVDALDGMADALTELCLTGKADFKDLARSVIYDLTRMMIKMQMAKALGIGGGGGGVGSYIMAGIGAFFGGVAGGGAGAYTGAGAGTSGMTQTLGGFRPTLQYGGIVERTGLAVVHKGETFSGIEGGNLEVHIHNEGVEKLEISQVESYLVSDRRIIDVTTKALQTDVRFRRNIAQVR